MYMLSAGLVLVSALSCISAQGFLLPCTFTGCQNGVCVMPSGPYNRFPVCKCNLGYRSNSDPRRCEDINECAGYPCGPPHPYYYGLTCVNTIGSYYCIPRPWNSIQPQQPSFLQTAFIYNMLDELDPPNLFEF